MRRPFIVAKLRITSFDVDPSITELLVIREENYDESPDFKICFCNNAKLRTTSFDRRPPSRRRAPASRQSSMRSPEDFISNATIICLLMRRSFFC